LSKEFIHPNISPVFSVLKKKDTSKNQDDAPDFDHLNDSQRVHLVNCENTIKSDLIDVKPKMNLVVDIFNNVVLKREGGNDFLRGNSLFLFGPENKLRKICFKLSESYLLSALIFLMIVLQTVTLALTEPLSDPSSDFNLILYKIDIVISGVFIFEFCLKIVSRGFLFNGEYSYLRSGWNQLDFLVVILSVVSLVVIENISSPKVLRNLRVVRPLRMITKNKGLKIAM